MGMAVKTSLWVAIGCLVAGKVPDYQSFISTPRQKHIRAEDKVSTFSLVDLGVAHFSGEVAKLVTHPLWPSRVPRCMSCSAMIDRGRGTKRNETTDGGGGDCKQKSLRLKFRLSSLDIRPTNFRKALSAILPRLNVRLVYIFTSETASYRR